MCKPCETSGTDMLLTKPYLGTVFKQIDLVSFFFPSMDLWDVVYIIWTLKPGNDLRPAKEMAFLVSVAGFAFDGHLSNWTIYDLKEQFWKFALWNMHLPTVHFLQERIVLVRSDLYEQKM